MNALHCWFSQAKGKPSQSSYANHRHTRFRTQLVNTPHYYNGASPSRMPQSARSARRGAAGAIDARARVAIRLTRDIAGICADEPSRVAYLRAIRPRAGPRDARDARARPTARARLCLLALRRAGARSDAAERWRLSARALPSSRCVFFLGPRFEV